MSKKKAKPEVVATSKVNIADCERKSLFSAHKAGETAKSLKTWLPTDFGGLIAFLFAIFQKEYKAFEKSVKFVMDAIEKIQDLLKNFSDTETAVTALDYTKVAIIVVITFLALVAVIQYLVKKLEEEKMEKAANIYYYFYKDMIEIVDQNTKKREAIRTLNGIVSYKVDAPVKTNKLGDKLMAVIVSILRADSREYWKHKYGFADVVITTTGNPDESIVLHDVADPDELIANIRKHYQTSTSLSVGNSFNL